MRIARVTKDRLYSEDNKRMGKSTGNHERGTGQLKSTEKKK
jgi:hypothetical protein